MPFKSEAQRRYLWANEPEIARDWTDTYGSRIQKNNGGIMDIASDGNIVHDFKNFKKGNQVTVPTSFQARSQSTPVKLAYITDDEAGILKALKPGTPHEGPMGIPNYNDFDAAGNYRSGAAMSAAETGGKTERARADMRAAGIGPQEAQDLRSAAINAGAGQTVNRGWFEPKYNQTVGVGDIAAAKAFRNDPNNRFAKQAYRNTRGSRFGIGNLLSGLAGLALGIPGLGLGINAVRSLGEYDTLSDWWGSRKNWNKDDDMSQYNQLGLYTDRINPEYYNDLDNEEMLSLNDVRSLVQASQLPQGIDFTNANAIRSITQPTTYYKTPFEGARTVDTYRGVDPYRMNYLNRDLPTSYRSESLLDEQPPSGLETLQPITFEEPTFEPYA
jgi:hypothetical protein